MVQCSLPALDCGSMGKDKQGVMRHYTGGGGKHNILKMWVDDFMQSWAVKSVLKVVGAGRGRGAGLTKLVLIVELPLWGMEVKEDVKVWGFRKARR